MNPMFHEYLSNTWNRDKCLALLQFLPLALKDSARDMGCAALSDSLASMSGMFDGYRAITRLSLLLNALSKPTLDNLKKPSGDALVDRLDQAGHLFHVFYCLFEHTSVLASHGVFPKKYTRVGACATTCWHYVLMLGLIRQAYVLARKPNTDEEKKHGLFTLVKLGCFFIFSMTCIPKDGPFLLENVSGPLMPLHKLLRAIAPRHLEMCDTLRGTLGFVASVCDFY